MFSKFIIFSLIAAISIAGFSSKPAFAEHLELGVGYGNLASFAGKYPNMSDEQLMKEGRRLWAEQKYYLEHHKNADSLHTTAMLTELGVMVTGMIGGAAFVKKHGGKAMAIGTIGALLTDTALTGGFNSKIEKRRSESQYFATNIAAPLRYLVGVLAQRGYDIEADIDETHYSKTVVSNPSFQNLKKKAVAQQDANQPGVNSQNLAKAQVSIATAQESQKLVSPTATNAASAN